MGNLDLIKKILDFPFTIYVENNCMYQNEKFETIISQNLLRKIWHSQKEKMISLLEFLEGNLAAATIQSVGRRMLLIVFISENESSEWTENDWDRLQRSISSALLLLEEPEIYQIEKVKEGVEPEKNIKIDEENEQGLVDNYYLEKIFFNKLKSGDQTGAYKISEMMDKINNTPLSENPLREKKYRLVSFVTLLTRSVIQNGCSKNLAYRLSDQLIQQIDKIKSIKETQTFLSAAIYQFSHLLKNNAFKYQSQTVNKAIEFIQANVYNKIINDELAEYTGTNKSYLSTLFKKETGLSIRNYINLTKIEEAKYLLQYSNMRLEEIAEALYYSSQSHFGKVFKEMTTMTPREYQISH